MLPAIAPERDSNYAQPTTLPSPTPGIRFRRSPDPGFLKDHTVPKPTHRTSKSSDQLGKTDLAPVIAAIIPCYQETAHILDVLAAIGPEVQRIYVIDDACPDGTGKLVEQSCKDARVHVHINEINLGVGGATLAGYQRALDDGAEIMVKLDGDGQMDPALIPHLTQPLLSRDADYTKGNRFHTMDGVSDMPLSRMVGNFILSFASKLSSGYWNIFDPTNGFTALHAVAARRLQLDRLSFRYFFESDMLFHLGTIRAVVRDVPMRALYGSETSGIRIPKVIPEFLFKHCVNTCKRIYFTYFVREPNVATLQLVLGKLLLLFGLIFGTVNWIDSETTGVPATAGTVVLAALPIIIGSQLLIAFLSHDTRNTPTEPLQSEQWPESAVKD